MSDRRLLRCGISVVTAWCLLLVSPAWAHADDGQDGVDQRNHVIAVNETDGATVGLFDLKIARDGGGSAEQENIAFAYARCERCQTVAVAVQIVLVYRTSAAIRTVNQAVAINDGCSGCRTLASAYQFVRVTGGPVRFTEEGREAIDDIEDAAEDAVTSDASIEQISADLAALMADLERVLDEELTPVGRGTAHDDRDEDREID